MVMIFVLFFGRTEGFTFDINALILKGIGTWGISMWREECCSIPHDIPNEGN